MTPEKLAECLGCNEARATKWAGHLTEAMSRYEINTPTRQAAFLAQIGHESGLLTVLEENLNYSQTGLLAIFPTHFTADEVDAYARHPEKIANRAYANRMGNGDEDSGDGWRFRGRGLIQLTGRDSYAACGTALGIDLVGQPDILLQVPLLPIVSAAALSAGWEWKSKGCSAAADAEDFKKVTKLINGGLNGYEQRCELWTKARAALGV